MLVEGFRGIYRIGGKVDGLGFSVEIIIVSWFGKGFGISLVRGG